MQGLFSQENLLLYDMRGNKYMYELLVKTIQKIPKITYIRPAGRVHTLTSTKLPVPAVSV